MTASPADASTDPRLLLTGLDPADDRLAALHARFAEAALDAGAVDVAYRTLDSPVGRLLVCATDVGVLRVAFEIEGHDTVLDRLATTVSPRIVEAPSRLDAVARELDEYFRGERRAFDLPLDRRLSRGFQRTVLEHLPEIGYGATASYASVALASGSPRAVRAVGTACATNPLPVVVPCHRVVRSDGTAGNYRGGMAAKRILIDLEARA
ncbi:methylated-DNA--[protein]-cysteine S-methyltransferase [Frigoribacterium sp. VKM Ac-2836]|uniref:methylated-DNA--[protein]-cysteine S-methyltransferase n=1 Tax=Frigoribacterium sp. VKM Ac-2836 TaxID=2739014 RepID=UPI00156642BD|nr:methylated-DNA--[protein]-cysteine S-methyltransferase [Frigoribacterium sp. VKM Ac-2836]NRD25199.1 methylated-DNA--[protein]-cysteine S-methyltransferase [Frigoribacterium sp. VKM Ac-2836]